MRPSITGSCSALQTPWNALHFLVTAKKHTFRGHQWITTGQLEPKASGQHGHYRQVLSAPLSAAFWPLQGRCDAGEVTSGQTDDGYFIFDVSDAPWASLMRSSS
jgi:hypothetical protein